MRRYPSPVHRATPLGDHQSQVENQIINLKRASQYNIPLNNFFSKQKDPVVYKSPAEGGLAGWLSLCRKGNEASIERLTCLIKVCGMLLFHQSQ